MSTTKPADGQPLAWREGRRIRAADGSGYSDIASDDLILSHIQGLMLTPTDPRVWESIIFAVAVLRLRIAERAIGGRLEP